MTDTGTTRTRPAAPGARLEAIGVGVAVRGGREVLRGIDLTVAPGRLVAVAGGSGAGKTLLLETLAAVRRPGRGKVLHDGADPGEAQVASGFVPQDDIVHRGLPLRRALGYSARLRGAGTDAVEQVLDGLGLAVRGDQAVGTLSGGERKRASIAVELLVRPRVLFLDEPTSGLDPATAAGLMETLATLAASGVTVVMTTHAPADLARCDEVVFLTPSGALAAVGAPEDVMSRYGVGTFEEVYGAVAAGSTAAPSPSPELPRPRAAAPAAAASAAASALP
ncbi:ABC transporter ATP-binding protein, partial [Streptomyces kunmingensis]